MIYSNTYFVGNYITYNTSLMTMWHVLLLDSKSLRNIIQTLTMWKVLKVINKIKRFIPTHKTSLRSIMCFPVIKMIYSNTYLMDTIEVISLENLSQNKVTYRRYLQFLCQVLLLKARAMKLQTTHHLRQCDVCYYFFQKVQDMMIQTLTMWTVLKVINKIK